MVVSPERDHDGEDVPAYLLHVETLRQLREGYMAQLSEAEGTDMQKLLRAIDEIERELFNRGIRDYG